MKPEDPLFMTPDVGLEQLTAPPKDGKKPRITRFPAPRIGLIILALIAVAALFIYRSKFDRTQTGQTGEQNGLAETQFAQYQPYRLTKNLDLYNVQVGTVWMSPAPNAIAGIWGKPMDTINLEGQARWDWDDNTIVDLRPSEPLKIPPGQHKILQFRNNPNGRKTVGSWEFHLQPLE